MTLFFSPLFLNASQESSDPLGQRFAIHHPPNGESLRGLVVYVHPFAEEMNKARRMAALQSRSMAEQGFAVVQIDLLGCGDSAGDFQDASWEQWCIDINFACDWLRSQHAGNGPAARLWLWGLRAGCLLASDVAARRSDVHGLLLWQPVLSGKQHLQQFLRLKSAAQMLVGQRDASAPAAIDELRSSGYVEVAGYRLPAALADGLSASTLRLPPSVSQVEWFELNTDPAASLTPGASTIISRWSQSTCSVKSQVVLGPSFWQTAEIELAPALVAASLSALTVLQPPNVSIGAAVEPLSRATL